MAIFEFMTEVFKLHEYGKDEDILKLHDTVTTPLSEEELEDLNEWMKDKGIDSSYKLICNYKDIKVVKVDE